MKKIFITIGIIALLILLIPVILICFAFGLPAQYDKSFYGGMAIKYDRLKNTEGKKIVVIGGSSVAFGLRSDLIEEEVGMPVINFGLYANLGTKYMLDVAEDYIGEGDIVIIAPEQNNQALSMYFNGEAVWYSVDGRFDILSKISRKNYGDLAKNFLSLVSGKFGYWQSGNKPCPDGVYNVNSFNSYGDIVYDRPYNSMALGYDVGTPISFDKDIISQDFIDYLNDFNKTLSKKGANVYYAFCPMNVLAVEENTDEDKIADYYDYLDEKLTFNILGNPNSRIMESEFFYDSNFHLNNRGSIYYSMILSRELKAELNDFSPVLPEIPDPPEKDEEGDINIGGSFAELEEATKIFNISILNITAGDGSIICSWSIDGLTEYGKTLSEIVIPDTVLGLPVRVISDEAFASNETVTKITFGKNISVVGQNVFRGCSNLAGVYITSLDPETYHPVDTVFNGAENCSFYVPEEVYLSKYIIDYYWGGLDPDILKSY